ncbi:hypothetical protein [Thalassoglobus polymorphus]|uniref:Uncharacterized protein n=1 Tax=Thalassoglobus polymorphus TaxID=2527994 RepID=A0A517QSE8_9PLAN|nr:hypothetical protein [Thalassoglobus polymorphus]QDT34542.1 hypothetical protein Mal48_38040 [Thalassoglobus polymorphus]
MTWQFAKLVSIFALVLLTGCASISSPAKLKFTSPFKKMQRDVSRETKKDSEARESKEQSAPKRQPLIARQSKNDDIRQHDAATERLIETELRDASPEEREEWIQYLATVDAAKVSQLLRARRADLGAERLAQAASRGEQKTAAQNTSDQVAAGQKNEIQDIKRVGHTLQPTLPSRVSSEASEGDQLAQADHSRETQDSTVQGESKTEADEPTTRKWSGQLKSLTEWEKNPLNFSRDEHSETPDSKRDRRSKPLPQIISIPFRNGGETGKDSEEASSRATTVLFEKDEKVTATAPSDSLRIAPGAKLWEEELHKLVSLMEAEASASGSAGSGSLTRNELRQQVALRMLYLVNDQKQLAMQPIPGLQPADQEFWTSIFWGLSNYLNEEGINPSQRSTMTIEQLRSATHYLQISAKLQLRNVSFCSRINGFGNFEPIDATQLTPGEPVLIYCDVRNFQSESSDQNDFITKLRSSVEIYQGDLNGQLVDRSSFPATEDRCQSIRTDYYNSYRIDLPAHLSSGQHVLKLTVYDEFSGKSATETISFTVR